MNTQLTIRSICTVVLTALCGGAGALSLGPVSGSTVVGQPLELSAVIQFEIDEPTQGGSGCVSAELLYGDKPLDSDKVRVNLTRNATRQVSHARISTTVLVDEPFVTLVLRAGCVRQSIRRYVLLADAPRDESVVLASASSLPLTAAPELVPVVSVGPQQARSALPAPAARAPGALHLSRSPVVGRASAAMETTEPRQAGRLQLALWDRGSERMPWLQEVEVSSLRSLAAGHSFEISSARESLQSAQTQGHANLAMTGVLAMLAGGGAAFFWRRSRPTEASAPSHSWYDSLEPHADEENVFEQQQEPASAARGQVVVEAARPSQPKPVIAPGKHVAEAPYHAPLEFTLPEPPSAPPPAALPQQIVGLNVDALHGAQQQSEFFVGLGQYDEAIAVLTANLDESSEKPVLPFLELFRIYHALDMEAEFEKLQSRFRQSFGIDATSFADHSDEHRELELYPVAVGRIAPWWPSQASQEAIEDLLFKKPAAPRDLLSLHAYRELLWLYSLGQEIAYSTGMPAGLQLLRDRSLSNDHFIMPWAGGSQEGPPELSLDSLNAIDVASELNAFAVDIDLTAAHGDLYSQPIPAELVATVPATAASPFLATDATDAFDAVMELESRNHRR